MPGSAIVAQGEMVGRPSFLNVDVTGGSGSWEVFVAGGVRIVGEGAFEV
jgi:predicted PhzF superfamily epimerase YddE/YHI9